MSRYVRCDEPGCKEMAAFSVNGKKYCHRHEADHRHELVDGGSISMTGMWKTPIGNGVTITPRRPLSDDLGNEDDVVE